MRDEPSVIDELQHVQRRFGAIGGGGLASSIGVAAFLSLFPLALVAIAAIGFVASGDNDFVGRMVRDLRLEGRSAEVVRDAVDAAEGSRQVASVAGLAGLLWSGLGVVGAIQAGANAAWQTTGRGLRDRLVAITWLVGAGTLLLATTALGPLLPRLPGVLAAGAVVLGLALTTALFVWTYGYLGNQPVPWGAHVPGALLVAVGFELLKYVGAFYVPRIVASSSALYGTLGVVFAILAWLLIYARLIVYGAVLNVVRWEAAQGTVTVEIEVPRIEGQVPVMADRGGATTPTPAPHGAP